MPIVTKATGVNWEKTLNPWTMFILLDKPAIINPDAKVKLNKNAVSIYFMILFMSWNSERRRMKPMIRNKTPTPMEMKEEMSWLRFQVGFL